MQREIFNHLGEPIGFIELPDEASEEVWAEELAKYALPPPTHSFQTITPRQIRIALLGVQITSAQVVAAIEAHIPEPDKTLALTEWEYSIGFERNAPFVDGVGQLLGLSSEQIDALWVEAAST